MLQLVASLKEKLSEQTCKPNSVLTAIYLGHLLPNVSSDLTREKRRAASCLPYLVLLRAGFTWPKSHPSAGELLPHHFTLTAKQAAVYFCGTFLRVASTGCYPALCPLKFGLSSEYIRDCPVCSDTIKITCRAGNDNINIALHAREGENMFV